jgi:hypothetical protein
MAGIRAVAVEALLIEDRPHIAVVLNLLRKERRGEDEKRKEETGHDGWEPSKYGLRGLQIGGFLCLFLPAGLINAESPS